MNQDSYNSNSLGFDQPQPPQSSVIHQPPQELSIQEMEDLKQQYLDELKRLDNSKYRDEIKIAELTENFNGMSIEIRKKEKLLQLEQWANLSTSPLKRFNSFCYDNDDEDYTIVVTPSLSIEEPDNSLNQFKDFSESNNEFSSTDDDSFSIDKIDYVEASPPDSELVSLETKSSSTSLNSLLEETNTFDNYLPESNTLCFDVEEISSGSTTTCSDTSLLEYEASYDNQSFSDEEISEKIFLKPLFKEEIIPMKMDLHYYNVEPDLMESL
nr:hypothetical protein [Tanacetum cinerariifolium]